ncbi:MAG TPA: hypothetical protein VGQ00_04035 [Candidatus Norongarragalinales archaeon]|jgi:hypothetical protein|nr:hypothetical protein [Candidatus Norongarragalinales archaeon]
MHEQVPVDETLAKQGVRAIRHGSFKHPLLIAQHGSHIDIVGMLAFSDAERQNMLNKRIAELGSYKDKAKQLADRDRNLKAAKPSIERLQTLEKVEMLEGQIKAIANAAFSAGIPDDSADKVSRAISQEMNGVPVRVLRQSSATSDIRAKKIKSEVHTHTFEELHASLDSQEEKAQPAAAAPGELPAIVIPESTTPERKVRIGPPGRLMQPPPEAFAVSSRKEPRVVTTVTGGRGVKSESDAWFDLIDRSLDATNSLREEITSLQEKLKHTEDARVSEKRALDDRLRHAEERAKLGDTEAKREIASLKNDLEGLKAKTNGEITQLKSHILTLQEQLRDSHTHLQEAREFIEKQERDISSKQTEINRLGEQLKELDRERQEYFSQGAKSEADKERARQEFARRRDELVRQMNAKQEQLDRTQANLSALDSKIRQFKQELEEARLAAREGEESFDDYRKKAMGWVGKLRDTRTELREALRHAGTQLGAFQSQLERSEDLRRMAEKNLNAMKRKEQELSSLLTSREKKLAQLEQSLKTAQAELEQARTRATSEYDHGKQLENELAAAQKRGEDVSSIRGQLFESKALIEASLKNARRAEEQLKKALAEKEKLGKDFEKLSQQHAKSKQELEHAHNKLEETLGEQERLKRALEEKAVAAVPEAISRASAPYSEPAQVSRISARPTTSITFQTTTAAAAKRAEEKPKGGGSDEKEKSKPVSLGGVKINEEELWVLVIFILVVMAIFFALAAFR